MRWPVIVVLPVLPLVVEAATSTPYDCETGNWQDDWSPGQRAWCCLYSGRGCPETTTSTSTQAPPGCGTVCDYGGKSFSCGARIRYTARTRFHGKAGSCEKAFVRVMGDCPECSHCPLAGAKCTVAATHMPAEDSSATSCSRVCSYQGKSGACDFRIRWGATHRYLNHKGACQKSWTMVASQCPICAGCTPDHAGCVEQGVLLDQSDALQGCTERDCMTKRVAVSFDCSAGFANWENGWSKVKKTWCCKHRDKACKFDCLAGFARWHAAWSDEKKAWCCRERGHGCQLKENTENNDDNEGSSEHLYDCLAGLSVWEDGWSQSKKRWCCERHGHGCPGTYSSPAFDCLAGIARWETGWSEAKKRWCCHNQGQGCSTTLPASTTLAPRSRSSSSSSSTRGSTTVTTIRSTTTTGESTTTTGSYDCHKDLASWKDTWSPAKKDWCCRRKEIHCESMTPHYDCLAGLTTWEHGWSDDKKSWCCRKHPKACEPRTLPIVAAKFSKEGVREAPRHPNIMSSLPWQGEFVFWVAAGGLSLSVVALVALAANRSILRKEDDARNLCRQHEEVYSLVATEEPGALH